MNNTNCAEWVEEPLKNFVDWVTYGFTSPMPSASSGPYMITAKDIRDGRIDYKNARHTNAADYKALSPKSRPGLGDVLLTKDGSIGRVAVCDREDICINQSVATMRPNSRILSKFLAYLLQSPRYQRAMESDSDGSTIKHIYITRVDKMAIMVPHIQEQKLIVDILDSIDSKISSNDEILFSIAQLSSLQFSKLSRRSTRKGRLGDVLDLKYGRALPKSMRIAGEYPVYGSGGLLGTHNEPTIVGPGLIVGRKGTIGSVYWSQKSFCPIDTTYYVVPTDSAYSLEFCEALLRSVSFQDDSSDSAVPGLSRVDALAKTATLPTSTDIAKFTDLAKILNIYRNAIEGERRTLEAIRDTLLPELMSARITVRDAQEWVRDAK